MKEEIIETLKAAEVILRANAKAKSIKLRTQIVDQHIVMAVADVSLEFYFDDCRKLIADAEAKTYKK